MKPVCKRERNMKPKQNLKLVRCDPAKRAFAREMCTRVHGRMARDDQGLPKVLPRPTMPYLSMPCGQATPEMASLPLQGWPTHRVESLRPSSNSLITPRHRPMCACIRRLIRVKPKQASIERTPTVDSRHGDAEELRQ
jgi:hypothetical protein